MEHINKYKEYCCVSTCKSIKNEIKYFHKPPKNPEIFQKWWIALKRKKLTKSMRVCHKHFKSDDYFPFSDGKRHILKKSAVPSLNLPITLLTSIKKDKNLAVKRKLRCEERERKKKDKKQDDSISSYLVDKENEQNQNDKDLENDTSENIIDNVNSDVCNNSHFLESNSYEEGVKSHLNDKNIQVDIYKKEVQQKTCFLEFLDSDAKLYTYSGIESWSLLDILENCIKHLKKLNKKSAALSIRNRIVLTFIKLKQNLSYAALAIMFRISNVLCKKYFINTLHELYLVLNCIIRWPSREEILDNMPKCFNKFTSTRIILDCLEITIRQSKCLKCRISTYSSYKSNCTVKFMLGVTPSGLISHVSRAYGGRVSDKQIFTRSKLLERMRRNIDAIMVDKGFLIDRECAEYGIKLIRPPFLRKNSQFTFKQATANADIASARVHVERRIQRIRQFKILKGPLETQLLPYINKIMRVICAVTNLNSPILASDKFKSERNSA